jgi:O-acetyl-ADP-ribose deacetylase (regulator of RNase III)
MPVDSAPSERNIVFVRGNALEPRGDGLKVIAHIVNDVTPNWGGKGFAQALRRKWPQLHESFINWAVKGDTLSLGNVHFEFIHERCVVASMVSQRGFGPSARARLSYAALESCLREVSRYSREHGASIHMPRIGCGAGGGSWELVEELINETLLAMGIPVSVYDLPGVDLSAQSRLSFAR